MKISVDQILQSSKQVTFFEDISRLNDLFGHAKISDFSFPPALRVTLTYYRSGADLFFDGNLRGEITGTCARCLDEYRFTLEQDFAFVLTPEPSKSGRGAEELHGGDLGLSSYSGDEVDLAPLIAEQVILALPTRPLCSDSCRGLCEACGANRNTEACDCAATTGDPRLAVFRGLKVGR